MSRKRTVESVVAGIAVDGMVVQNSGDVLMAYNLSIQMKFTPLSSR